MNIIPLTQMASGESGIVAEIHGGQGVERRLAALGLRTGEKITKISAQFLRGPVTAQTGRTQIAIGFGMANKIMVEVE